jgi:hypothetical protein
MHTAWGQVYDNEHEGYLSSITAPKSSTIACIDPLGTTNTACGAPSPPTPDPTAPAQARKTRDCNPASLPARPSGRVTRYRGIPRVEQHRCSTRNIAASFRSYSCTGHTLPSSILRLWRILSVALSFPHCKECLLSSSRYEKASYGEDLASNYRYQALNDI